MTIEELVRAELRSVAEQVDVPPLPSLEEPRRRWGLVVAAAAAVVLLIGGLTFLLRGQDDRPPRPIEKPKIERPQHVDRSAPMIPWIDGDRLYVRGRPVSGRWLELTSRGETWLARRADGRVFWGRGARRHDLGRHGFPLAYDGPYLSPDGRYIAVGLGEATLVNTATGRTTTMPLGGADPDLDVWVAGVTDAGAVLFSRVGANDVGESYSLRAGRTPVRLQTGGGILTRTTASGLLFSGPKGNDWVVDVVGSRIRRVLPLSSDEPSAVTEDSSLSTDRQWLLDLGWARDRDEPRTLPVTSVGDGRPAPVNAPDGWVFAPQLAPGYWEPQGTLIAFVVRPENREYRAVRCAAASGDCVLLEES